LKQLDAAAGNAGEDPTTALVALKGIEDRIWVEVAGFPRVFAIADEDLERENAEKTSSVHFVRFELTPKMIAALKRDVAVAMGADHPAYEFNLAPVPEQVRQALVADLA
jgi:hypothetical protein